MSKINVKTCATSDVVRSWEEIDFSRAEKSVKKLQRRIATAVRNGDFDKATTLYHRLIHSFYAKALAVKKVTSAKGKRTAGVDGVIWRTPEDKFNAIGSLTRRGYKFSPHKRIYIPKKRGGKRAISIPTMRDRAWLTLHKFALEPIAEVTADENSFGFRPARSASQAVRRCMEILSHEPYPEWILKTDVKSFFDSISQEWMMEHIPMDKTALRGLLSSGYVCYSIYHMPDGGIPQGGSLSNVISNMSLDGLADVLLTVEEHDKELICGKDALPTSDEHCGELGGCDDALPIGRVRCRTSACRKLDFGNDGTSGESAKCADVRDSGGAERMEIVRYADDIVIISDSPRYLVGAETEVSRFLAERGLSLSKAKTKILNAKDGVIFLGYEIHKDNGVVYAVPSKKGIDSLLSKVKMLVASWPADESDSQRIKEYNNSLKSILGGWVACYKGTATIESLLGVREKLVHELVELTGVNWHPAITQVKQIFNNITKEVG